MFSRIGDRKEEEEEEYKEPKEPLTARTLRLLFDRSEEYKAKELSPRQQTKEIEKILAMERRKHQQISRVLVIGLESSGKSTLVRTFVQKYGDPFSKPQQQDVVHWIRKQVLKQLLAWCRAAKTRGVDVPMLQLCKRWESASMGLLTHDECCIVHTWWNDESMRACLQDDDLLCDYVPRIHQLMQDTYVCSQEECDRWHYHMPCSTSPLCRMNKEDKNAPIFQFVIVRDPSILNKQLHCFENVQLLVCMAPIVDYSQSWNKHDDELCSINRLEESLNLCDVVSRKQWFGQTDVCLICNKMDLLAETLSKCPFSHAFEDFQNDPYNVDDVVQFVRTRFETDQEAQFFSTRFFQVFPCTFPSEADRLMQHVSSFVQYSTSRRARQEAGLV